MNIETWKLEDIKPYENNPKLHNVEWTRPQTAGGEIGCLTERFASPAVRGGLCGIVMLRGLYGENR